MKYYGIGRRKSAVAKVYISEKKDITKTSIESKKEIFQENEIIINNKTIDTYFQKDVNSIKKIQQILAIFAIQKKIKINILVSGGGIYGQKDAICLGLSKALYNSDLSNLTDKKNLLTQDARVKERKKYGLKKARKAPQYSKR